MKKDIAISTIMRVGTYLISFASVPVALTVMGVDNYGIWVTLTSLITWIFMFDMGIGNSLKSRIAELVAHGKITTVQDEVLGLFKIMIGMSILILVLFTIACFRLTVLRNHVAISIVLFIPIIIAFPFSLGTSILHGLRKVGLQSFLNIISPLLFFLFLLVYSRTVAHIHLFLAASVLSFLNVVTFFISFTIAMKNLGIKIGFSRIWRCTTPFQLLKTSVFFFILQVTSLVLFSFGNYLVYNNLGPSSVAHYDILNKIFVSMLGMFNILISVAWPEIAHQRALKNYSKLINLYYFLVGASVVFAAVAFTAIFMLPGFVQFWTKGKIFVDISNIVFFSLLVSVQALAYSGAVFLNAFGKVMPQVYFGLLSIICMLPLARFLFAKGFDIASVPIASTVLLIPVVVFCLIYAVVLVKGIKLQDS